MSCSGLLGLQSLSSPHPGMVKPLALKLPIRNTGCLGRGPSSPDSHHPPGFPLTARGATPVSASRFLSPHPQPDAHLGRGREAQPTLGGGKPQQLCCLFPAGTPSASVSRAWPFSAMATREAGAGYHHQYRAGGLGSKCLLVGGFSSGHTQFTAHHSKEKEKQSTLTPHPYFEENNCAKDSSMPPFQALRSLPIVLPILQHPLLSIGSWGNSWTPTAEEQAPQGGCHQCQDERVVSAPSHLPAAACCLLPLSSGLRFNGKVFTW